MVRTRRIRWAALWVTVPAVQLIVGLAWPGTFERPTVLFWMVVVAATQCAAVAVVMLVHAFRVDRAETGLLGAFVLSVSILPLAHGLLTPGVLHGPNPGAMTTVQIAVPIGGLALLPFVRTGSRAANRLAQRWRRVVVAHVALSIALFGLFVTDPYLIPAARTGSPGAVFAAATSLLICLAMSYRHQRLAEIAQNGAVAGVAGGFTLIGAAPMMFVAGEMYGAGFWLAHVLDVSGVVLVSVFAVRAHRRTKTLTALLAPIDAATPLRAVELGLDPLIHHWVAALDSKDQKTRDHVVRTAQLAVLVATELQLAPSKIRLTGIGAILHDVGKLDIPNEILTKPGRLTEAERAIMESHTTSGAARLAESPVLFEAAPIVASHHERVDGRGYPRRLVGSEIPIEARIVAACDAYDAMTSTRHYREEMTKDRAEAILREHAGAQWDTLVVDALLRVVDREPQSSAIGLEGTGKGRHSEPAEAKWLCPDAFPEPTNIEASTSEPPLMTAAAS